jgi:hypothetical protein
MKDGIIAIIVVVPMLCLFLYLGYVSIVDFYIRFKEHQENKLRQEVYQIMKEQKELEKLLNQGGNDEEN